ncbi:MAG: chalcone isomerase family protein [Myxococcales bacterium]|nr:chalcone isomerase family protein [Myxococcales bacterium]
MNRTLALILSFCVLLPLNLSARSKEGVSFPDSITVDGKTLVLNGLGTREATVFNVNVYVAGLYLEQKSSDAAAILSSTGTKRLVLKFVRDVERDDIVDAWSDGFEKNAKGQLGALKSKISKLNGWMADMAEGENLSFTYIPQKGTTVEINGKSKGTIDGDDFARALFSIWLGSSPPNSGLKSGLLGK